MAVRHHNRIETTLKSPRNKRRRSSARAVSVGLTPASTRIRVPATSTRTAEPPISLPPPKTSSLGCDRCRHEPQDDKLRALGQPGYPDQDGSLRAGTTWHTRLSPRDRPGLRHRQDSQRLQYIRDVLRQAAELADLTFDAALRPGCAASPLDPPPAARSDASADPAGSTPDRVECRAVPRVDDALQSPYPAPPPPRRGPSAAPAPPSRVPGQLRGLCHAGRWVLCAFRKSAASLAALSSCLRWRRDGTAARAASRSALSRVTSASHGLGAGRFQLCPRATLLSD